MTTASKITLVRVVLIDKIKFDFIYKQHSLNSIKHMTQKLYIS